MGLNTGKRELQSKITPEICVRVPMDNKDMEFLSAHGQDETPLDLDKKPTICLLRPSLPEFLQPEWRDNVEYSGH